MQQTINRFQCHNINAIKKFILQELFDTHILIRTSHIHTQNYSEGGKVLL